MRRLAQRREVEQSASWMGMIEPLNPIRSAPRAQLRLTNATERTAPAKPTPGTKRRSIMGRIVPPTQAPVEQRPRAIGRCLDVNVVQTAAGIRENWQRTYSPFSIPHRCPGPGLGSGHLEYWSSSCRGRSGSYRCRLRGGGNRGHRAVPRVCQRTCR